VTDYSETKFKWIYDDELQYSPVDEKGHMRQVQPRPHVLAV